MAVDAEAIFALSPRPPARELARLPAQACAILRLCDGKRSLAAICAASALDEERTRQVLHRLQALGVIVARAPAFTAEEEQFFASPIDHLLGDD